MRGGDGHGPGIWRGLKKYYSEKDALIEQADVVWIMRAQHTGQADADQCCLALEETASGSFAEDLQDELQSGGRCESCRSDVVENKSANVAAVVDVVVVAQECDG